MTELKIERGAWVVVCDGKKALLLENVGGPRLPNLKTREVYRHEDAKTREQGSDAPGRAFAPVGGMRSAMDQTDWHDQAEREFLENLAGRLDAALTAGETKAVVMVAPPRALGVLRHVYSPTLRQSLRGEVDKDLVRMPVHEIEKHLSG